MAFGFSSTNNPAPDADVPKDNDIDPEAWRRAEEAVRARNGGFAGVSDEGKYNQIKEAYDLLVENNKKAADWEG
jgi:hypothetical protein